MTLIFSLNFVHVLIDFSDAYILLLTKYNLVEKQSNIILFNLTYSISSETFMNILIILKIERLIEIEHELV